jgi:hypothetical protein
LKKALFKERHYLTKIWYNPSLAGHRFRTNGEGEVSPLSGFIGKNV